MTVELRLSLDLEATVSVEDGMAEAVRDRIEEAYRAFAGTLENLGLTIQKRRSDLAVVYVEREESVYITVVGCAECRHDRHHRCSGYQRQHGRTGGDVVPCQCECAAVAAS